MKKIVIIFIMALFLSSCESTDTYTTTYQQGLQEVKAKNYEKAFQYFEEAREEKDTVAVNSWLQTTKKWIRWQQFLKEGQGIYLPNAIIHNLIPAELPKKEQEILKEVMDLFEEDITKVMKEQQLASFNQKFERLYDEKEYETIIQTYNTISEEAVKENETIITWKEKAEKRISEIAVQKEKEEKAKEEEERKAREKAYQEEKAQGEKKKEIARRSNLSTDEFYRFLLERSKLDKEVVHPLVLEGDVFKNALNHDTLTIRADNPELEHFYLVGHFAYDPEADKFYPSMMGEYHYYGEYDEGEPFPYYDF